MMSAYVCRKFRASYKTPDLNGQLAAAKPVWRPALLKLVHSSKSADFAFIAFVA